LCDRELCNCPGFVVYDKENIVSLIENCINGKEIHRINRLCLDTEELLPSQRLFNFSFPPITS
jgi:hypothetical protein